MALHRPAADLMVQIVNADADGLLDREWVSDLLARDTLPVRYEAGSGGTSLTGLRESLVLMARDLRPVFEASGPTEAARLLNELLSRLDVQVSVSISDAYLPHLHFDAHGHDLGQRLRVNGLVALATVLADPSGAMRLGVCASPSCDHVFVDHGRSARQRFCSRRCATRSHVSDHRRRQSGGER